MANEYKYIGKNYTTPDLVAKVTGKAKYAEDYRAEGMLFVKLLLSPMPHARVRSVDATAALALPGVKAILRASDFPAPPAPPTPPGGQAPPPPPLPPETALTDEPVYQGEPILAIAAVDENTAVEAIELIKVDYEPLPFSVDPIDSLRPNGANARTQGNVYTGAGPTLKVANVKWTDTDFAEAKEGRLPMGEAPDTFVLGDIEEGFKKADLILDETLYSQSTGHQPLETRTAMAYWQGGKLFLHGSTQSVAQTVPNIARMVGLKPEEVVLISEFTGGGFGSKIPGSGSMAIPALLSKKLNGAPVMMRITREEEHYIGRARAGIFGRAKVGFRKDGRIVAMDFFTIQDNGPYNPQGDHRSAGAMASLNYQPETYRWRGISVLTNTPPRTSQRSPGGMQMNALLDPVMAQAAQKLGIDHVELLKINAPSGKASYGPIVPATKKQAYVTQANVREALDQGKVLFGWEEKKATAGQKRGSKVRGVGTAVGVYTAGSIGFDGLAIVRPDGKVEVHTGIGNLGTESVIDCQRVYAEVLDTPWEQFEVVWGNTAKGLPWSCVSAGSQTVHAMTRAAHAAATDLKTKLQEVAAKIRGGNPASYTVANGKVGSLTFAEVAKKAIELGGKYDGHEGPEDINVFTKNALKVVAGMGVVGVAKDTYKRDGNTHSFVAAFAEVEVDTETGAWRIVDYTSVADVGTVLHPRNLQGQTFGGSMLGMGHAISQRWVYDKQYGVCLARRFHHNKPPSIMDIPATIKWEATNIPDPETPVGARGIGEPPVGAGCGAVAAALVNALGAEAFRRYPMTPDLLLTSIESKTWQHDALVAHI